MLKSLADYEAKELGSRFVEWEKTQPASRYPPTWVIANISKMNSQGGAITDQEGRRQHLVTGTNPPKEILILTLENELRDLTGIRIEALKDSSLIKNGRSGGERQLLLN